MDSKKFEAQLRKYETALDQMIPPGLWMIVRLDGIAFTRTTKRFGLHKPFDPHFTDAMMQMSQSLLANSGFQIVYAYTMSDEISLLIAPQDQTFGRKTRKILSSLASHAGAAMQREMERPETRAKYSCPSDAEFLWPFDARISVLPDEQTVVDYFRWRLSEATRNCINNHCYWTLRQEGKKKEEATLELYGKSFSELNDFLFDRGVNFNELPLWQRRGIGVYKEVYRSSVGGDSIMDDPILRKRVFSNEKLPKGDDYSSFLWVVLQWYREDKPHTQLISQERLWFEAEALPDLLSSDKYGKHAVVFDKKIQGFFRKFDDAYAHGLQNYGRQGFLLIQVKEPEVKYAITHF